MTLNDDSFDIRSRPRKVGMKDIAKEAGVSISTVSLVLNGKPGVSTDVRERVIEVARTLGYEWRSLYEPKANTYSIFFPASLKPLVQTGLNNEIYGEYLEGFDAAAKELNAGISYVANLGGDMGEIFTRILESEVSKSKGAIFCSLIKLDDFALSFFKKRNLPVVLLNRILEDDPRISYVSADYLGAVYHMVSQLVKKGCKKVIYMGLDPSREIMANLRIKAYSSALTDNGLDVEENLILLTRDPDKIAETFTCCYPQTGKDIGVFASTLAMVRLLMEAIKPLDLKPGRDFKLAGGELLESMEDIDFNSMDTVSFPYFDTAYHALKTVDTLASNATVQNINMLLGWEYIPQGEV